MNKNDRVAIGIFAAIALTILMVIAIGVIVIGGAVLVLKAVF